MRAEQLAHKFWLALDSPKGEFVQASINGASIAAKIRTHDAYTCVAESLTLQWETAGDWDELVSQCGKGLRVLHAEFTLVERDDLNRCALFRSPVSRNLYWEAKLQQYQTTKTFQSCEKIPNLLPTPTPLQNHNDSVNSEVCDIG
jgi:hypothetical protein